MCPSRQSHHTPSFPPFLIVTNLPAVRFECQACVADFRQLPQQQWRAEAARRPDATSSGFLFWLSDTQREAQGWAEKEVGSRRGEGGSQCF